MRKNVSVKTSRWILKNLMFLGSIIIKKGEHFMKFGKYPGEKLTRFSIRKYHFGAASVAVASLLFFGNGIVQAAENASAAADGTHQTVAGGGGDSSGDSGSTGNHNNTATTTNPTSEEATSKEAKKANVTEEAKKVNVTDLKTALEELESKVASITDEAKKAKLNSVIAEAKKVLADENATQEQIDSQVTLVKDAVKSVPEVAEKVDETKPSEEDRSATPESSNREKPTPARSARGRRGRPTDVQPADSENATPKVEPAAEAKETPKQLPTYTNGDGTFELSKDLYALYKEMKKNNEDEEYVKAIKNAYDSVNMALSTSEDGQIDSTVFAKAVEALAPYMQKNSVDEIEKRTRETREAGKGYKESRENWFDDGKDRRSPYAKYTYVFISSARQINGGGNPDPVTDAKNYLIETVTPTETGFKWRIVVNGKEWYENGRLNRKDLEDNSFWFTVPKDQTIKPDTVTVSKKSLDGVTNSNSDNTTPGDRVVNTLKANGIKYAVKGTTGTSNARRHGLVLSVKDYAVSNFNDLARQSYGGGFYTRNLETSAEQPKSNEKYRLINDDGKSTMYYAELTGKDRYEITFETTGHNDITKLRYASGIKGLLEGKRFLVNQWFARTDYEKSSAEKYNIRMLKPIFVFKQGVGYNSGLDGYGNTASGFGGAFNVPYENRYKLNAAVSYGYGSIGDLNLANFDFSNYWAYTDKDNQANKESVRNKIKSLLENNGEPYFYDEDGNEVTRSELARRLYDIPGEHEYKVVYKFKDGSENSEIFRAIVQPKKPYFEQNLTGLAGETRDITVTSEVDGTNGARKRKVANVPMTLYKRVNGKEEKVAEATTNERGVATFKNVAIEKASYYVRTEIDTEAYRNYHVTDSKVLFNTVSENSDVKEATDTTPPVVRIGNTDLPETRRDSDPAVYEVTQGQPFAPDIKVFDNVGEVTRFTVSGGDLPGNASVSNTNILSSTSKFVENSPYRPTFTGNVPNDFTPGTYTRNITVTDGNNSKTYYFKYKVLPVAPTITTEAKYNGTLVSTDRSISGTGIPDATITVTLQDGTTTGPITVNNQGKWTYNLNQNEKLTQNTKQDANTKANRGISITQSKNGAESRPATVDVQLARAISIDPPVQAGRDITVKIPHDAGLFYVQVKNGSNTVYEYGVRKVGNSWQITDTAKANLTELRVTDGDNVSEKVLTFHIKDPKNNIPFTLSATNDVTMRVHYDNSAGNPSDPGQENSGWITAAKPTNTNPTITVKAPNTRNYTADGSLTMAGLKDLVTVTDQEDDANKTVGRTAKENLSVTIRKDNQNVSLSGNDYLKKGTYTLTYETRDAAGATVSTTHNITVSSLAESKGASITYPVDTAKVVYGNSDVQNGNFKPAIKQTFADKLTEVNRNNNTLPTINGRGVTFASGTTNNKSEVVVATFPDGSTLPISHDKVAKPEAPTVTPKGAYAASLDSTERSISGTGIAGATIKITLQDSKEVSTTVGTDGNWKYELKAGEVLTQNKLAGNTSGYNATPVRVKQVFNNVESDATSKDVLIGFHTLENAVAAGRDIKFTLPKDVGLAYVQMNNYREEITVKRVNGTWQLAGSFADKLNLAIDNQSNPSITKFHISVKDPKTESNIPFRLQAGDNKLRLRMHNADAAGNPVGGSSQITVGEGTAKADWIFANVTNTAPTITVNAPNTHNYTADGSLTMAGLKALVTVADTEDDANKTVGRTAKENLTVTVKQGNQVVNLGSDYLKKGTYTLTYTTRDAAGVTVTKEHTITVNYTAVAKPTINLLQGESLTEAQKRSLLQLQDGTSMIDVPGDARVDVTLDTSSRGDKTASATVVFADDTRTTPVTINYKVLPTFPVATTVYDFAGVTRNQDEGAYYSNTGLPDGFNWFVRQNGTTKPTGFIQNYLRDDRVGTTDYVYGAKYREGRFTNNAPESDRLEHSGTVSHTVFDVGANTTRIMVNSGGTLSDDQARTAVMPINNSAALPNGTTYEWVNQDGTPLTNKQVTEKGEATRYVKVTLPKTSVDGPAATQYQAYKIVEVKINEAVKPTVSFDGSALSTDARNEAAKFVVFRGATFDPTFTVNDNSGKVSYLKVSGLPSGREFVKDTETNNGNVQLTGNEITATSNASLGDHIGKVLVKDASGNEQEYQFKYTVVDFVTINSPKTVEKDTQLGNAASFVKVVDSGEENAQAKNSLYPNNATTFTWKKDNATVPNTTALNIPGRVTGNKVVITATSGAGYYTVNNVKTYMPATIERDVTFLVKPTAPTVTAADNGDVTITPVNEPNVNKIQVTYTPSPTIATLTETDQDTFVEHPTTQLTASKNAQNKWSITEGAQDGIRIDETSGAITINDATVKDGSRVVATAITSDRVESAENRATAQDGDKTNPTVGLGNTLVQTGKQITLNLNVSDSGVGVDDSKVEVKNLPAGLQYNSANQTITGSIATASKTDIKVLVRDKKGNKTVKTVSLVAIQPKPIYVIKDGTIPNVGTASNFVEVPTGVTNPSVAWKDGQPTTTRVETTHKIVTVSAQGYTSTEVDVPVTVYPKVTYRKVGGNEVTEYDEIVGQPLTSRLVSGGGTFNPVTPDYYIAFEGGTKPDGTRVEFEGGTPADTSEIAGITTKTIKVTYPNGAGSVTKTVTFRTYGNEANYETGKDSIETTVGTEFSKLTARNSIKLSDPNVPNPDGIFIGWYRNGNYTPKNKIGKRNENVNVWYGSNIESKRGDNTHNYSDQNIPVNLTVKPQAPTIATDAFHGKGATKPAVTVSNIPTANQLEENAKVTVELYQGGNKVASKELSRDEVTNGAGSVRFDAVNYNSNLTLGEKVHAVVKVEGGSGTTAYNLSSANSNDVQVTPQKPTFDTATVTSTSRTLSGTLGGFNDTNRVVELHLNDEANTVLSSARNEVTLTGDKWTANIPEGVKLRASVAKNGETTTPPGITVLNKVSNKTVSTTSDAKEVAMGAYSVSPAIAGSKHIDITVPHDAKRVELRFHNNQEKGDKPNSVTLVRGADGTWHTEATRADNTSVTDANGYVGTITSIASQTNPAESIITIPLNEESNGKKLHIREEAANGDNTATYGKGLGLRVEYQPEAGQDPTAAGNWKVANVTNTAPNIVVKNETGRDANHRKIYDSGTTLTADLLKDLVTVTDVEDSATPDENKPFGTGNVKVVSGLPATTGTTPAGVYEVTLAAVDSQGKEGSQVKVYVAVKQAKPEAPVLNANETDASVTVTPTGDVDKVKVTYTPTNGTAETTIEIVKEKGVWKEKSDTPTPGVSVNPTSGVVTLDHTVAKDGTEVKAVATKGNSDESNAGTVNDPVKQAKPEAPVLNANETDASVTVTPTGDGQQVPATQPAEQPSQTVEVPAQLPNEVSETDSSVSQPQAVLPNTGTKADRATGALGVLSLLGAFGLLFAKKKKDDEEEA